MWRLPAEIIARVTVRRRLGDSEPRHHLGTRMVFWNGKTRDRGHHFGQPGGDCVSGFVGARHAGNRAARRHGDSGLSFGLGNWAVTRFRAPEMRKLGSKTRAGGQDGDVTARHHARDAEDDLVGRARKRRPFERTSRAESTG